MRKLVLESLLLAILGIYNVRVVLASYEGILNDRWKVEALPAIKVVIPVKENYSISSNVLYVRFDEKKNVEYTASFNDAEMEVLTRVCKKLGPSEFEKFMGKCNGDKDGFIGMARDILDGRLHDTDLAKLIAN